MLLVVNEGFKKPLENPENFTCVVGYPWHRISHVMVKYICLKYFPAYISDTGYAALFLFTTVGLKSNLFYYLKRKYEPRN